MSDDTVPPPPPMPAPEPSALKSLLNPIQSGAATPSSVIVEPPKSPQPAPQTIVPSIPPTPLNGANYVTEEIPAPLATAPMADVTQSAGPPSLPPLPVDAQAPLSPSAADEPPPTLPSDAIPPAVSTPSVITQEAAATPLETTPAPPATPFETPLAPAIPDATPPPPPPAADPAAVDPSPAGTPLPPLSETPAPAEATPAVEPSPIPVATPVQEPSVPPVVEQLPAVEPAATAQPGIAEPAPIPVDSTPAPAPGADIPAAPFATASAPTESVSEPMQIDEPEPSLSNGLKRPGEELEGGDEKRIKEESTAPTPVAPEAPAAVPAPEAPAPTAAPATEAAPSVQPASDAPTPAAPAAGSLPPPAVGTIPLVVPPEPQPEGPTTPLTPSQRSHLQNAIKNMKKSKESQWFSAPVDYVALNIPHYPQYILKPMDLGTVETKLYVSDPRGPPKDKSRMNKWDESKGKYNNVAEVVLDVRQIWWNTSRFNGPDHFVTLAAHKLDNMFNKALKNLPVDKPPTPAPTPSASAGPSSAAHARRPSVSQAPVIRRTSDVTDRPKREIHPPPSKELPYAEPSRKPKRRNDPQLQWALRTLKGFESSSKTFDTVSPFLYDVNLLVTGLPDYSSVIKKPIDLNMIKAKLEEGVYDEFTQVDEDMKLMISNALAYNKAGDPVAIAADQVSQLWNEKLKSLPAKPEVRDSSEDVAAASIYGDSDDDEDDAKIAEYEAQISDLQSKVDALRSKAAKRKANKAKRPKKSGGGGGRKGSTVKTSPGVSNGHAKKARRPKDVSYRDDDDDDDEVVNLTTSQKTDLAEKIQNADGNILQRAITIIQKAQDVGSDGEIELDIDSLPPHTVKELYILVCGPIKKARKSNYVPTGKKPGRKPGGPRKSMNEAEEAERIARMQAQLDSFDGGRSQPVNGYGDDDSDSSEEEESDLD